MPRPSHPRAGSRATESRDEERESQESALPVVGIGASAGGVAAVTELLRNLPGDLGMAFVVVQHLDPTHESHLTELLSRAAPIPVTQIGDGTPVKPNQIYVIPPNANLSIDNGILRLTAPTGARGHQMPVDRFLRSLAEDRRNNAIGVILSGMASDGSQGLKAIKARGGITFAQDLQSAQYDGMPSSAVAAGAVDFIMPPKGIALELSRIARHPYLKDPGEALVAGASGGDLGKIFSQLLSVTGVNFRDYKPTTIMRRIKRRMVVHRMDRLKDYARYLGKNPVEVNALYQDLLINVTSFFRDPETFKALERRVFPEILKHRSRGQSIRVWVPGCSTGEEAYSLAMALQEFLDEKGDNARVRIFATDISDTAIEKARAGIYPASVLLDVSPDRLRRFLRKVEDGYQIARSIRDLCIFARHNLLADPPFSGLDLISCRNLLIYLGPALQKKVMPVFHYALRPTGFLLLGPAETIGTFGDLFAPGDRKHRIYSRRSVPRRPVLDLSSGNRLRERVEIGGVRPGGASAPLEVIRQADRAILGRFAPPGVLINADMEICQFRGDTGSYLGPVPGRASLNLMKMARQSLLPQLHTVISRVKRDGIPMRIRCGHAKIGAESSDVFVDVIPVGPPGAGEKHFLVLFQSGPPPFPDESAARGTRRAKSAQAASTDRRRMARMTEELSATKEYLSSIIEGQEATNEELRSANEEILSSNEELQSMNEELETAKEELESGNEELNTVNAELQSLNLQLTQTNDDLANLLHSVSIPIVMVDDSLHIRRFTPAAQEMFHLSPADEGRRIDEVAFWVDVPDLRELIDRVIDKGGSEEREVAGPGGRWHSMQIRPYRTAGNEISGAVLTLLDIDQIKRSGERLQESRDFAEAVIETVHMPLAVLDRQLQIRNANRAFIDFFETSSEKILDQGIQELPGVRWEVGRLEGLLRRVLAEDVRLNDLEFEAELPRAGARTVMVSARRLVGEGERSNMILLVIRDITERRRGERRLMVSNAAARVLVAAPTLEEAIPEILQAVCESLGWDYGEVWRVDAEANVLRLAEKWHRAEKGIEEFGKASEHMTFRSDVGVVGRVWSSRRPHWVPDLAEEEGFPRRELAAKLGLHSALGFPVLLGDEVHGVIEFFSRKIQEPDETLLHMMANIGIQIGQYIQRRRAESDLQSAHADLETRIAQRTAQLSNTNRALQEEIVERKQAEVSLRQLSTRLLRVQDEERQRLARDLHDSTAQSLAALSMNLALVGGCRAALDERAKAALDESVTLAEGCSTEIRSLSYLLHPPLLEEVGLPSALRWCVQGFARRSGISVDLDVPEDLGRLPMEVENALFRIVQECLTNVHRHSGSATARIRLARNPSEVALEVQDEGRGLPGEVLVGGRGGVEVLGVGLLGMRERVRQLGGELRIDSSDRGATIQVEIPVPPGRS